MAVESSAAQVQQGSFHTGSGLCQKAIVTAEVKLNCAWRRQKYEGTVAAVPGFLLQVFQQTAPGTDELITAKTANSTQVPLDSWRTS